MHDGLTNLLPRQRLASVRRTYFLRLATLTALMLALAVFITAAMLVPAYIYVERQIAARTARSSALDGILAASGHQEVSARLTALSADATYLERLASTTTASGAVRAALSVPRSGVTVTSITYTPGGKGTPNTMTLAGVAATRESLRQYVLALEAVPFIDSADLPINAYAKETNIDFVITLKGSFMP